jgi:hypothetical protein
LIAVSGKGFLAGLDFDRWHRLIQLLFIFLFRIEILQMNAFTVCDGLAFIFRNTSEVRYALYNK